MAWQYPHMCRDEHVEIGHADSEHERCPMCRLRDALYHINSINDHPGRFNKEIQDVLDSVIDTSDVKF